MKKSKTAYLAQQEFPALIEVQEQERLSDASLFVDTVSLLIKPQRLVLAKALGLEHVVITAQKDVIISLDGRPIQLKDLL